MKMNEECVYKLVLRIGCIQRMVPFVVGRGGLMD